MTRLLLLLLGLLAPATVRAAIVKLAKAAPAFASAAVSSAPALVDPVAVPIVSDPVVAAAVVSAAPRAPETLLTAILKWLHHSDVHAPTWIVAIDHNFLHTDVLEDAWRLAGGNDLGLWMNNLGALSTLAAFSMQDVLLLRCLSIVGQLCGIYFCATRDPALWNPVAWQLVFLGVTPSTSCSSCRIDTARSGCARASSTSTSSTSWRTASR